MAVIMGLTSKGQVISEQRPNNGLKTSGKSGFRKPFSHRCLRETCQPKVLWANGLQHLQKHRAGDSSQNRCYP